MKKIVLALCFSSFPVAAANPPSWTEAVEPFRIAGNIHYVGTEELASFLITTPDGHILLDAPMDENVAHILGAIEQLGYRPEDIRILINSHAHFDHAGGFAALKERTGARLFLSAADAELAERGGLDDFAFGDKARYAPVRADAIVRDGETVSLGGTTLTALLTPGHTRGGTSWTTTVEENGERLRIVFANSMTAPTYRLVDNVAYPNIMDDYRASFERLRALEADVFLAPHGSFFGLTKKIPRLGGPNPFIDREALSRYVERMAASIEKQYAEQRQ